MSAERADAIRREVTQALSRLLPSGRDDAWIERYVDPPRFGWDWEALEAGFFGPFRRWADAHPQRLRPVFSGLVMEALGVPADRYAPELATLEMAYLAVIMVDGLRNAKDLAGAATPEAEVPLSAWVTAAYNIRQLVGVLIARQDSALCDSQRRWLVQQCGRFLFRQGVGNTLDLWGSEQGLRHESPEDFTAHLRLHIGNLSLGLASDFAAAAVEFSPTDAARLRRAAVELGVAWRMSALAVESGPDAPGNPIEASQQVRWRKGVDSGEFPALADQAWQRALTLAGDIKPTIADAFADFGEVCGIAVAEGTRP